jgi:hypothetical protein
MTNLLLSHLDNTLVLLLVVVVDAVVEMFRFFTDAIGQSA